MSILDILEAHDLIIAGNPEAEPGEWKAECSGCDWEEAYSDASADLHMRHVAQVLEQHEREAEARAWSNGFHKGRKTENGSHISTWPENPSRSRS